MSVVVLFEAEFVPGGRERYLALAQKLAERARFSVSVDVHRQREKVKTKDRGVEL